MLDGFPDTGGPGVSHEIHDLRARRKSLGLPLSVLADEIGVRPITVLVWERGYKKPSDISLRKWLRSLTRIDGS